MQRQRRTTYRSNKTVFIIFLLILSCTIAIFATNQQSTQEGAVEAGQPSPDIPTIPATQVDEPELELVYTIVIDPGHGGKDPGANGASEAEEKEYTLDLSQKVYNLLKQDSMFDPYITRTDDTFVSLEDRAMMANDLEGDAFISIHGNTFSDPEVNGTETFYYSDSSKSLAEVMHKQIIAATGFKDRGLRQDELRVLRLNETTSILVEVGYISNRDNEAVMLSSVGQDHIAQAIVNGLKQYFK